MKIIKKNSPESIQVEQFAYRSAPLSPLAEANVEDLMGPPLGEDGVEATTEEVAEEAPLSDVDLEAIEKAAYENGFREGEQSGREAAERELEEPMRNYAASIAEIQGLREKLFAQAEREVVQLAIEVAKKIVHREIQADPQIIQTLVNVALSHVAETGSATILLHPSDHEALAQTYKELQEGAEPDLELKADKSMQRGGCLIQTDCGDVDARIEEGFREIQRGFFESLN